ncbi:MAG TPA: DUF4445 domain-containing protein, partial [Armatimonadetes bacterium]|nr:DUF4445 domain-containing protein [Armatimonadota bacterium]
MHGRFVTVRDDVQRQANASSQLITVVFEPRGARVRVPVNTTVLDAARRAGVAIESPCGGMGICGKCRVRFAKGAPAPTEQELHLLQQCELEEGYRLACRARLSQDAIIFVPRETESVVAQILERGAEREAVIAPLIHKWYVELPQPSLHDERGDWERLINALDNAIKAHGERPASEWHAELKLLRSLPHQLRRSDFKVTVVTAGEWVLAVEPHDTTAQRCGMAFDIGTTTVVGYLIDLSTGINMAVASTLNPQMAYGDDLISRITFAMENDDGAQVLHRAIIDAVNELIEQACAEANVAPHHIYQLTVVGNTCMMHLFLGLPPHSLGVAPYVPVQQCSITVTARELGLHHCPSALVHVLPNIGGFVGADTVAMILVHLLNGADTALAIDIGTNSEVVVKRGRQLWAASAAAGPAFEGARIQHGMRASAGAIYAVSLDGDDIRCATVDSVPPHGICGTGLIDAVATLLELNVLDESGRICSPDEVPTLTELIKRRIVDVDGERQFVLASAEESATDESVVITQSDVRQLQLAKGS